MDTIYVTGHRNPDTDSIVSAIAYAGLQNSLGNREYQAARLGPVSEETQTILNRFRFQAPKLLNNVRTQVRDLDYDTPPLLNVGATVSRAWELMQGNRISAIPVVNEDGTLYGTLSAGDIAAYDTATVQSLAIRDVPLYNLLSVIEGKVLNSAGERIDALSGTVTIALPTSRKNLLFSDPESIVICGDQPDMIRHALDLKVACIIVCQSEISEELRAAATNTCLIATALDAYRTVRSICHALPVSRVCSTRNLVTFHITDYIDDVRETVLQSRFRAYPILDEDEHVVGTLSRYHLLRPRRKRVVLVDHNEKSQSVPGLDQAEIVEIIDHHRLADIQTGHPVFVRNEPVGSTATIIAEMYQERGLLPSEKMAGLLASAMVSDTIMFKSPTCTPRDVELCRRMARIANVSVEDLGHMIFSTPVSDEKSARDLLASDYKEFQIAGRQIAVTQITCFGSEKVLHRKAELLKAMQTLKQEKSFDLVLFMLTDVLEEGTRLLFIGDRKVIQRAFNCQPDDCSAFLPGVVSRKKQIIPALSAYWG